MRCWWCRVCGNPWYRGRAVGDPWYRGLNPQCQPLRQLAPHAQLRHGCCAAGHPQAPERAPRGHADG
eukprot:14388999-Alexandrium_andersonii.AAC.1